MYKLAQLEDKRTTLDNVAWYVHWHAIVWEDRTGMGRSVVQLCIPQIKW